MQPTRKRLLAPLVALVASFMLAFYLTQTSISLVIAQTADTAELSLAPPTADVVTNEQFDVGIGLTTGAIIKGIDVILTFDSTKLEVVDVENGNTELKTIAPQDENEEFDPVQALDTTNPTEATLEFGIVAYDMATDTVTEGISGIFDPDTSPLATVTFRAKASGTASIGFVFDGDGVTTDSNVVSLISDVPEDILTQPTSSVSVSITSVCYDFNGNNEVDVQDLMQFASRWNAEVGDPTFDTRFDIDHDGDIDIVDIQTASGSWGTICGGTQ